MWIAIIGVGRVRRSYGMPLEEYAKSHLREINNEPE
jgi:hypothetical protein